jgi:hypothetical protein
MKLLISAPHSGSQASISNSTVNTLPDSDAMKEQVIDWEKQFFEMKLDNLLYLAPIDTTFALYRPRGGRKPANFSTEMYRTDFPYIAGNLPWYVESLNPDYENRYYMEHSLSPTSWTSRGKDLIKGN